MSCMTMQGLLEEVVAHWLMFPKVCGFMGGGNTAFRVEFLRTRDEGRGARYGQRGAFFEGRLFQSGGRCF